MASLSDTRKEEMIRDQFISICNAATKADAACGENCRVMEPFYQELISLAEGGNDDDVKKCFVSVVEGSIDAPSETLACCMRALRYPEVLEASNRKLSAPPEPRWMNEHFDIKHAIEDEIWEDADLWEQMS